MSLTESKVVVAPDGAGKAIRNLSVVEQVADVPTLVQMQVVVPADENGNPIGSTQPVLEELLTAQERTAHALELLVGMFGGSLGDEAQVAGFVPRTALGPAASPLAAVTGICDPFGRQIVMPWGARDMFLAAVPATISDTTLHTLQAGVNDVFLDLVLLLITNTSASTNSRVDVSDGTNIYAFQSIGGAGPVGFSSGLILPATKRGADWTIQAASAVTDLRVTALFVRNK